MWPFSGIEQQLKKISEEQGRVRKELEGYNLGLHKANQSLSEHMRRTEIAEQRLGKLESWLLGLLTAILLSMLGILLKVFS